MRRVLVVAALLLAGCGIQPTEPIRGVQSARAMIYLVDSGVPVPVLRTTRHRLSADEVLSLLATSPTTAEREGGLTTEVPPAAAPISISGTTVTLQIDPSSLSGTAAEQIACTAAVSRPVSLVGAGQTREPVGCPV